MNEKKVLVLTVGGSPRPIITSLEKHRPDIIYLLPSAASEKEVKDILKIVYPDGHYPELRKQVIANHNDLFDCYRSSFTAFKDLKDSGITGENIIADPTGGTKIMSAGLLLAVLDIGISVSYVGGEERTKDGLGVVVNGAEKVIHSFHPYDIIAKADKERFCQYFNSYRFTSAVGVCNAIIENGSDRMKSLFKALRLISEGYREWDLFRLKNGHHQTKSGYGNLKRYLEKYPDEMRALKPFADTVSESLSNFEVVLDKSFKGSEYCMELVQELIANALRRAEEGKYDDAVARLYRALEMVAQARIWEIYGHRTNKFPYKLLSEDMKRIFADRVDDDGKIKLACRKAFDFLYSKGDEYGKIYKANDKEIISLLNQRNQSILAHGEIPLTKDKFDKLYEIFTGVFKLTGKGVEFAKINFEDIANTGIEL